jgi:hypothetical protein
MAIENEYWKDLIKRSSQKDTVVFYHDPILGILKITVNDENAFEQSSKNFNLDVVKNILKKLDVNIIEAEYDSEIK